MTTNTRHDDTLPVWQVWINGKVIAHGLFRREAIEAAGPAATVRSAIDWHRERETV